MTTARIVLAAAVTALGLALDSDRAFVAQASLRKDAPKALATSTPANVSFSFVLLILMASLLRSTI